MFRVEPSHGYQTFAQRRTFLAASIGLFTFASVMHDNADYINSHRDPRTATIAFWHLCNCVEHMRTDMPINS